MKVIPKFQEGGFMSLFTQYTPVQTPTETPQRVSRSSQEKEEKEDDKITEKDLTAIEYATVIEVLNSAYGGYTTLVNVNKATLKNEKEE